MKFTIREAVSADIPRMKEIMIRLAEFEMPAKRKPEHFYAADDQMVSDWGSGKAPNVFGHVAVADGEIVGLTFVTMKEELFDHSPSAHLETVAIDKSVDGHGLGKILIDNAESEARKRGAGSMSLHVLHNNFRARHVYKKIGYEEEMIRCIKHFD